MAQMTLTGVDHVKFSAEAFRRVREKRGLTQDEVAEELGVSSQAVSAWERGAPMWSTNRRRIEEWLARHWYAAGLDRDEVFTLRRFDRMPLRFKGSLLARDGDCAIYRTAGGQLVIQAETAVFHGRDDVKVVNDAIGNCDGERAGRLESLLIDHDLGVCEEID